MTIYIFPFFIYKHDVKKGGKFYLICLKSAHSKESLYYTKIIIIILKNNQF